MKQIMILLLALGITSMYFSCDNDNSSDSILQEEMLIEQIVAAPSVEVISVQNLPSSISNYVQMNHAFLGIEMTFHASPYGYEVFLENGLCIYFDETGNHLNHDGMHGDMGNHHGGGDHGIDFCLAGDTLDIADLPLKAINHINENYPGANAFTVVVKPSGNLAVKLSTGESLMFSPDCDYFQLCEMQATGGHGHGHGTMRPGWHCDPNGTMGNNHGGMGCHQGNMGNHSGPNEPCWGGTGIEIADLPSAIIDYVSDHHPDDTIEHAMQAYNNNFFLRLSNCVRLVFDENGEILFDSGG